LNKTLLLTNNGSKEENTVPEADKASLRNDLVPAMIALSAPTDKPIRAQIAESISLIASVDFPQPWSDLIDVSLLVSLHLQGAHLTAHCRNWLALYPARITQSTLVFFKQPTLSFSLGVQLRDPTRCTPLSTTSCHDSASRSSDCSSTQRNCF
jgi:hypothetical protein